MPVLWTEKAQVSRRTLVPGRRLACNLMRIDRSRCLSLFAKPVRLKTLHYHVNGIVVELTFLPLRRSSTLPFLCSTFFWFSSICINPHCQIGRNKLCSCCLETCCRNYLLECPKRSNYFKLCLGKLVMGRCTPNASDVLIIGHKRR